MRAPDRRPRMPHRGPVGAALVSVLVLVVVLTASLVNAHAGSPTPQIRGSVAAPTAASVSPICDAPDPTGILGPSSNLPSNPTSTLITPKGGVVNFTATSSNLYVDTGSQLITYTLAGAEVSSFDLPPAIVNRHGNEVTQPVVDPSGNIYIASYYDQVLDKFSPNGRLLWSVDPGGDNPTGLFSIGTGSGFELALSNVQHQQGSDLIDLSTGAVTGSFPLFDDFDYVSQEAGRQPALLGQRLRGDHRSDRQGAVLLRVEPGQGSRGPHRLGQPVLLSGPGRTGAGRDHLHCRPPQHHRGHQPPGLPRRQYHARPEQQRRLRSGHGWLQLLSGRFHLLLSGGPALQHRRRQHLDDRGVHPHRLPRRRPRPDRLPRMGCRPVDAGLGQLLRRRDHPPGRGELRPVVAVRGLPPAAVVLDREHHLARRRDRAVTHHDPTPHHQRRTGRYPSGHSRNRPTAWPLPGAGIAVRHEHHAAHPARHHLHALYRRDRLGRARPGQPPERHRRRRAERSARCRPQRPAGPGRTAGGDHQLEQLPPQLLALQSDRGDLRPVGHDLRQRHRRLLQGRLPGSAGPRHLLAPGQRGQRWIRPDGAGDQRVVEG